MKYKQGKIGRVFVARVEHGDDLLEELKKMAEDENIESAVLYVLGAIKKASLVAGPEKCTLPPAPVWRGFTDCREVLGIGTLFWKENEPLIHLHATLARGDDSLMGCIRGRSEVYIIAEVIVIELTGTGAFRELDEKTGLKLLNFLPV